MRTIRQNIQFDAGHRLLKHTGKCRNYHGHRYLAWFKLTAVELDEQGMVLDFGEIKKLFGAWIDSHLDHRMILQEGDPAIDFLATEYSADECTPTEVLPFAPTAENLAYYIWHHCRMLLPKGTDLLEVELFETPNCSATFAPYAVK